MAARIVQPWSDSRGLAAARNVCADEAAGVLIRFQDDDDAMDPYASTAMLRTHARYGLSTAILGFTGVAPNLRELPLMEYLFSDGLDMFSYRLATDQQRLGFDCFWGGRTSVATNLCRRFRFDENLRFGSEDVEFAFRASINGDLSVVYDESVRSYMIRAIDLDTFVNRCYRQGVSARYAAVKHPGTPLELWALNSHLYSAWDGDASTALVRALKRCRRLEFAMDLGKQGIAQVASNYARQGIGYLDGVRRALGLAYRETFGLARAVGFLGLELP
jgi:hypothetical protein